MRAYGGTRLVGAALLGAVAWALVVTAGCSQEKVAPSDPTGPQSAVRSLIDALNRRDAEAVKNCFAADTPEQDRYVTAMAGLVSASVKLRDAAAARFGKEDAKQLNGASGPGEDHFRRFVEGRQEVNGDQATLVAATGQTLKLRKAGGQWKLVPTAGEGGSLEQATAQLDRVTRTLNDASDAIGSGKLTDIDVAKKQIQDGFASAVQ